jgi:histidyl-tRNA synthetase
MTPQKRRIEIFIAEDQHINTLVRKKFVRTFARVKYVPIFAPAFERKHTFSTRQAKTGVKKKFHECFEKSKNTVSLLPA